MPTRTETETRAKAAAARRTASLKAVARAGGPEGAEAERIIAEESTAAGRAGADTLAALPKSIAEAIGDARAFSKADIKRQAAASEGVTASTSGRASMARELRKMGMEPVR